MSKVDNMKTNENYRFISAPYTIDRKLYKYYSDTKYAIDCIINKRIHLDDPRSFNDPFDAAFQCAKISALTLNDSELLLATNFFNYICLAKEKKKIYLKKWCQNIVTLCHNYCYIYLMILSNIQ